MGRPVKTKLLALLAVGLFLAGCSSISEGYITEKNHQDAYTTTTLICASYGKYGCTSWIPSVVHHPESWWFSLVENTGASIDQKDPKTGWVYVGPQTFEEYEVGDYYEPPVAKGNS